MATRRPMPGQGSFHWNAGGWFGLQIGGTGWMLTGAVESALSRSPWLVAIFLACFAAANAVGAWLWRRRDRIPPYPAIQILLWTTGGVGSLAMTAVVLMGPGHLPRAEVDEVLGFFPKYVALFVVLSGAFHLMERRATKVKARQAGPS